MTLPTPPKISNSCPMPLRHTGGRRRAHCARRDARATRLRRRPGELPRGRHAGCRQPLCAPRPRRPTPDVRRAHRCRAGRGRGRVVRAPLCGRNRRRPADRPRRRRHEGRHRLFHRGSRAARARRKAGRELRLAAHHRRRGRPLDQRHRQADRMGGCARRALGRRDRRRADQHRRDRRHDQDRPARVSFRHDHSSRGAGTRRLSASGRQSRLQHAALARRAGAPARRGDRPLPRHEISKSRPSTSATPPPTSFPPAQRRRSTSVSATCGMQKGCRRRSGTGSSGRLPAVLPERVARRSASTSPGASARARCS